MVLDFLCHKIAKKAVFGACKNCVNCTKKSTFISAFFVESHLIL